MEKLVNYLAYKEGVSGKIKFTFSNIEFLKDRPNFLGKIVKFANFDIFRTASDENVSRVLNIIYDIVIHFGC